MVKLGHVALRVRDLERAVEFYRSAVGLTLVGRIGGGRAALLTGGSQHHELLLVSVPSMGAQVSARQPLYHVAWKVGDGLDALRSVRERLDRKGFRVDGAVDHRVSWSLYMRDPEAIRSSCLPTIRMWIGDAHPTGWRRPRSRLTCLRIEELLLHAQIKRTELPLKLSDSLSCSPPPAGLFLGGIGLRGIPLTTMLKREIPILGPAVVSMAYLGFGGDSSRPRSLVSPDRAVSGYCSLSGSLVNHVGQ